MTSAEPVEFLGGKSGSADGGNLGEIGTDERPPGPSDADDVRVVDGTSLGGPAPAAPNGGFIKSMTA